MGLTGECWPTGAAKVGSMTDGGQLAGARRSARVEFHSNGHLVAQAFSRAYAGCIAVRTAIQRVVIVAGEGLHGMATRVMQPRLLTPRGGMRFGQ